MLHKIPAFLDEHLDPSERLMQVLFGLIMVLTTTLGAYETVEEGEDQTKTLLRGVVGCNFAWGIIAGVMYVIDSLYERSRTARLMRSVQISLNMEHAIDLVRDELDGDLVMMVSDEERIRLYEHIVGNIKYAKPPKPNLEWGDLFNAMIVFLLVFLTVVPAVLPFLFIHDLEIALRVSNGTLVALLFVVGYRWGHVAHLNPWLAGPAMMMLGLGVVGIAVAFGG